MTSAVSPRAPVDWYVVVDDSEQSLEAIKYAVSTLAASGDSFQLVRALPPKAAPFTNPVGAIGGGSSYSLSGSRDKSEDLAEGKKFLESVQAASGLDKSTFPSQLHVIEELSGPKGAARALDIWLRNKLVQAPAGRVPVLVSGHHSKGKIAAKLGSLLGSGSVSHSLALASRVPTLVVPDTAAKTPQTGVVVVAVDGSDESQAALQWAVAHVVREGDALHVLRVAKDGKVEAAKPDQPPHGTLARISAGLARTSVAKHEVDDQLSTAKKGVPAGVPVTGSVLAPNDSSSSAIATAITTYASNNDATLLVIGSRGIGAIRRSLLGVIGVGSVSSSVLDKWQGRILLFKDQDKLASAAPLAE